MADEPIDFEAARIRRKFRESNDDQAHWEEVQASLIAVMATSELSDTALMSATLHALMEVVGGSLDQCKERIRRVLAGFF